MSHASTQLSITFVCQSGDLEIKAALLVASLRQYHPAAEVELIACYPQIEGIAAEVPGSAAEKLFAVLAVVTRPIEYC